MLGVGGFKQLTWLQAGHGSKQITDMLTSTMCGCVPQEISELWAALVHSLSGIFCASLNLLEGRDVVAQPAYVFAEAPSALAGCAFAHLQCETSRTAGTHGQGSKLDDALLQAGRVSRIAYGHSH